MVSRRSQRHFLLTLEFRRQTRQPRGVLAKNAHPATRLPRPFGGNFSRQRSAQKYLIRLIVFDGKLEDHRGRKTRPWGGTGTLLLRAHFGMWLNDCPTWKSRCSRVRRQIPPAIGYVGPVQHLDQRPGLGSHDCAGFPRPLASLGQAIRISPRQAAIRRRHVVGSSPVSEPFRSILPGQMHPRTESVGFGVGGEIVGCIDGGDSRGFFPGLPVVD